MPNNFTIEGRALAAGFKDIQRTWLWELNIELRIFNRIKSSVHNIPDFDTERFLVHCRSAQIPGRSQEMIMTNFAGMKQYFPGRPSFEGTFQVTVEETEDMYIKKVLERWQENIFGTSNKTLNQGFAHLLTIPVGQKSALVARHCELQLFKYDGTETDKKFRFKNAMIQSVGQVAVGYGTEASVTYPVTFQYDYYDLINK